jgi:hypothetical protein
MWIVLVPFVIVLSLGRLVGVSLRRPHALLGSAALVGALVATLFALTPLHTWQGATIGRQVDCGSVLRAASGDAPCPRVRADRFGTVLVLVAASGFVGLAAMWQRRRLGRYE